MANVAAQLNGLLDYKRLLLAKDERIAALQTENAMLHIKLAECHGNSTRLKKANSALRRLLLNSNQLRESLKYRLQELYVTIKILKEQLNNLRNVVASYPNELAFTFEEMQSAISSLAKQAGEAAISQQVSAAVNRQLVGIQRQLGEISERYEVEKSRRKSLHNTLVELRGNIRVHCRVRPVLPFDEVNNKDGDDPSFDGLVVNVMDEVGKFLT
jgi:kinesin family protein 25